MAMDQSPSSGSSSTSRNRPKCNKHKGAGRFEDFNSASNGLKGKSFEGGATITKVAKTWGACDDQTE
jgi:hypothetical protein